MFLSKSLSSTHFVVIPTRIDPYVRPLWQIDTEFSPKHLQSCSVVIDFTDPDAFVTAFDEADFLREEMEIEPCSIPLCGRGRQNLEIIEFGVGKDIVFHELLRQFGLGRRQVTFCPPLGVILYALKAKNGILEHPVTTIFPGPKSLQYCFMIYGMTGGLGVKAKSIPMDCVFDASLNYLMVDRAR